MVSSERSKKSTNFTRTLVSLTTLQMKCGSHWLTVPQKKYGCSKNQQSSGSIETHDWDTPHQGSCGVANDFLPAPEIVKTPREAINQVPPGPHSICTASTQLGVVWESTWQVLTTLPLPETVFRDRRSANLICASKSIGLVKLSQPPKNGADFGRNVVQNGSKSWPDPLVTCHLPSQTSSWPGGRARESRAIFDAHSKSRNGSLHLLQEFDGNLHRDQLALLADLS